MLSHILPDNSEHPTAFASRTINKHEKVYSHLDKEGVAIIFGIKKFHQYVYGRHFTLVTDNQVLRHIFATDATILTLAAARLVRWSIMLCAYHYDVEFRPTHARAHADMLSRLPLPSSTAADPNSINTMQIDFLPITANQIREATQTGEILQQVLQYCRDGLWSKNITADIKPYYDRRHELFIENDILLWGLRVIYPLHTNSLICGNSTAIIPA